MIKYIGAINLEVFRVRDILSIFTNDVILVPLAAWILAQLSKAVINLIIDRKFSFERLFGDGGMPSGHSATVMALVVMVGWRAGFDSAVFAIALILAIVVMHDACGVRRETGKHAASIKELADAVNLVLREASYEVRTERLKLLVGNTPLQVFFGALLGASVSTLYIVLFLI